MLGLDTNVLVRFFVRDDPAQYGRAHRLISDAVARGQMVFVSHLVLLETEWVLRSRYSYSKNDVIAVLVGLLESTDAWIEDEASVEQALLMWRDTAAEFADCLIGAHHMRRGCTATATFDTRAARLPGFVAA
ncbi:MAG: type II toxin-antitoxin system VapC family toxin [Gammaproteobacteria bacterium]|nr:type II toxin-antitoxin system VapC family toxin [Gammaproteobacteria bacterium]